VSTAPIVSHPPVRRTVTYRTPPAHLPIARGPRRATAGIGVRPAKYQFVTGVVSGIYLVLTAVSGLWFGGLDDRYAKRALLAAVVGTALAMPPAPGWS
jgi:hypothetical protein